MDLGGIDWLCQFCAAKALCSQFVMAGGAIGVSAESSVMGRVSQFRFNFGLRGAVRAAGDAEEPRPGLCGYGLVHGVLFPDVPELFL